MYSLIDFIRKAYSVCAVNGMFNWMSDERYLSNLYRAQLGEKLNLDNPIGFNEKTQWLKLHDRKTIYTTMVDKYEVKKYIANLIGEEFVIPTYGVWDSFDEIDFDKLPNQFVLKTTHDSGGMVICRDKKTFNFNKARKKLTKSLKRKYFYAFREWPYKDVKPRILAEKYMTDEKYNDSNGFNSLNVYKILTFGGEPKIIQTIENDKTDHETIDYFDCEWNLLDLRQNYPNSPVPLDRPKNLDKMLELSRLLSQGTRFVRVDLYEINNKVYFSEFTFFSDAGFEKFNPEKWDKTLGDWIRI